MSTNFKDWMRSATTTEQKELAEMLKSSVPYLHQIANGTRAPSARFAVSMDECTKEMSRRSKGRLPHIQTGDVCSACLGCPYFQKCANKK